MSDLFNSPVLTVEQPSADLLYQITDSKERVLASVSQVVGAEPRRGLGRLFSSDPYTSRVVVRVARQDGTPLFFVDRAERQQQLPVPPPCAIVAPDGQIIGRFEYDTRAWAQSWLDGRSDFLGGQSSFVQSQQLFDRHHRPLCAMTWEKTQVGGNLEGPVGGRHCTYADMNGVSIARLDDESTSSNTRFTLQLQYQLPEPLRTLVIATPVALGLWPSRR
ncbi:hypothetical protein ACFP2T_27020 [Plantactinospora solaniradicis]|uniref:Scramblase n=1 Tax=Plantactinospora solaniradicis TaxID=1723736 RepID=A0ABW1KFP2_9ACTN